MRRGEVSSKLGEVCKHDAKFFYEVTASDRVPYLMDGIQILSAYRKGSHSWSARLALLEFTSNCKLSQGKPCTPSANPRKVNLALQSGLTERLPTLLSYRL